MAIFLETERLILKGPEWSDLENLIALRSDPEVMKFIISRTGSGKPQTREQVERFLKLAIEYQEKYGFGCCSVFRKEDGDFIGQAGLFHLGFDDKQSDIEIAFRLQPKYWGRGYATELTNALISWGFEHLSNSKLVAVCSPENVRSRRVLEKAGLWYARKVMYYDQEFLCYEIYKNDAIELEEYNQQWPKMAQREIEHLDQILPKEHIIDIQHVGSTAIPGMVAKPIIDIQIVVDSLAAIKQTAIDILQAYQYVYWAENPDPERMFFVKGMPPYGEKRTHHIHIYESSSKYWRKKIMFRDYLMAHPDKLHQYAILKKELSKIHAHSREQYTDAKTKFVQEVLQEARKAGY